MQAIIIPQKKKQCLLLRLLIPMHVKRAIPQLSIQPSSWRWTQPSGSKHLEDI